MSNWHKRMGIILRTARMSEDASTQNAADILFPDGGAIAGLNEVPFRLERTADRNERPRKYFFWEHAERAAIYSCVRSGIPTNGATMVCPWAACADCARAIVLSGIVRLVRLPHNDWSSHPRWAESCRAGDDIMRESGVEIVEVEGHWGIKLLRDGVLKEF